MLFNYNYDTKKLFNYNDMMFKCSIIIFMITVRYSTASNILNFYIIHNNYTVSYMHTFKSDFTLQCNNGC